MPNAHEHLLASTFWGIHRPAAPLTPGHFLIRLNDPDACFGEESAADLLRCYAHLRLALTELAGACSARLYAALNWQPVGDALGEPLPESSTLAVQVFFTWPGNATSGGLVESTTPTASLGLPSHQRVPATNSDLLDEQVRTWNGGRVGGGPLSEPEPSGPPVPNTLPDGTGPNVDATWAPEGWAERPFHVEPAHPGPGQPFRGGHWTALPRFGGSPLDTIDPASLPALASTLEGLASHSVPPYSGISVWTLDSWEPTALATIHIFARQRGDDQSLLADFVAGGGLETAALDRPGQSSRSSHNVEK